MNKKLETISKDIFICPKCGSKIPRTNQYYVVLNAQNNINLIMGNKKIKDLCSDCNYFANEEE